MCPAFGSLRVGPAHAPHRDHPVGLGLLRLRPDLHLALLRRAPQRRLRALQQRDAGHRQAVRGHPRGGARAGRPASYDAIVIINLCVPTASGVPLQLLPKRDQRRAHHRHRRAGLRRARPTPRPRTCWPARCCATPAPRPSRPGGGAARTGRADKPTVTLLGEMFPADPVGIGRCSSRWAWPPARWCPRANGASCMPRSTAWWWPRSIRSTPPACASSRPPAARRRLGAGGRDGTEAWLQAIGRPRAIVPQAQIDAAKNRSCRPSGRAGGTPIKGRITLSGYEGSELLVARLLVESGADRALRRHGLPAHPVERRRPRMARGARRARAVPRLAGAGPGRDARVQARPGHRHHAGGAEGQGAAHPGAVLHQPDLGAAADGPGRRRLAGAGRQRRHRQPRALRRDARLLRRRRARRRAGVWEDVPADRPEFRAAPARRRRQAAKPQGRGDPI
jgi:chlorophyllide a reductase subunit Y